MGIGGEEEGEVKGKVKGGIGPFPKS